MTGTGRMRRPLTERRKVNIVVFISHCVMYTSHIVEETSHEGESMEIYWRYMERHMKAVGAFNIDIYSTTCVPEESRLSRKEEVLRWQR